MLSSLPSEMELDVMDGAPSEWMLLRVTSSMPRIGVIVSALLLMEVSMSATYILKIACRTRVLPAVLIHVVESFNLLNCIAYYQFLLC